MTSTNEMGPVVIADGETPRTITIKAREDISGGQFVVCSGTGNNPVTSGLNSFVSSDIEGALVADGFTSGVFQINGIALQDIASGTYGTIAKNGTYIVKCGGSVIEGTAIEAADANSVQSVTSGVAVGVYGFEQGATMIGRALSAGASGTNLYCIADFHF